MKWIGLPLIILCSLYAGKGLWSELAERERLLGQLCGFLNRAACGIRLSLEPLDRIVALSAAPEDSPALLKVCARRISEGSGFHEAWNRALNESPDTRLLREGELRELARLGDSLGYSDVKGELSLLGQALEYFCACREVARTELREKSRMYMTCSLLTGLTIVLLLL